MTQQQAQAEANRAASELAIAIQTHEDRVTINAFRQTLLLAELLVAALEPKE